MDIKDFILIGGGLLIAMVVAHGFWIAWRAKREPLRMDIAPDLIPNDVDDMERLRGELPNGGARVVGARRGPPAQTSLELEAPAPTLMDLAQPAANQEEAPAIVADRSPAPARRPKVHQAPARPAVAPAAEQAEAEHAAAAAAAREETRRPATRQQTITTSGGRVAAPAQKPGSRSAVREVRLAADADSVEPAEQAPVDELLVLNLLARRGERFQGEALIVALRNQGLRYGEMSIFHRIDPATKAKRFSVANVVEPGTFDLSDLANMQSPGMSFFLQLPGPEDASAAFEDMLRAARNVAQELGGDLRDEQLSMLTGQTTEHMRQRIADFARRRLSKRA